MPARRVVPLVVLLALLAACSAVRLSYDNADWVLARMASDYVDMDRAQSRTLKVQLMRFHIWHRSAELPRYAALLDEAAVRIDRGLSREDVAWAVGAVRTRYRVLSGEAAQKFGPLLFTLNDRQLDGLEASFVEANRKFYVAKLPKDAAAAAEKRADWISDRVEDWTGTLTPAQRARVVGFVQGYPDLPALRLADRQRWQAQLLVILRAHDAGSFAQAQLTTLITDPGVGRGQGYRQTLAAWEASFIDTIVDLDRTLTPRQRAMAVERMRRYAQEFRSMANDRGTRESTAAPAAAGAAG